MTPGDDLALTKTEIFDRLTKVLRSVFDNEELVATPTLTAKHVNGWDSLNNVRLFLEVEGEFAVRFSATEISSLKSVGELADLVGRKTHRTAYTQRP